MGRFFSFFFIFAKNKWTRKKGNSDLHRINIEKRIEGSKALGNSARAIARSFCASFIVCTTRKAETLSVLSLEDALHNILWSISFDHCCKYR